MPRNYIKDEAELARYYQSIADAKQRATNLGGRRYERLTSPSSPEATQESFISSDCAHPGIDESGWDADADIAEHPFTWYPSEADKARLPFQLLGLGEADPRLCMNRRPGLGVCLSLKDHDKGHQYFPEARESSISNDCVPPPLPGRSTRVKHSVSDKRAMVGEIGTLGLKATARKHGVAVSTLQRYRQQVKA